MRVYAVVGSLACIVCTSVQPAGAQSRTLTLDRDVKDSIASNAPHEYEVSTEVGDLVSGVLTLNGALGSFTVIDPARTPFRSYVARDPAPSIQLRVGFLAAQTGTYRLRITVERAASYSLRLTRAPTRERLRDVRVQPRITYQSARIQQLTRELKSGQAEAVERFWRDAAQTAPFVERVHDSAEYTLATFVWRSSFPVSHVLLLWPPTSQGRAEEYAMSNVASTDVWYKTIRVHNRSRFSYMFSPDDTPADRFHTMQQDPLNARRYPEKFDPLSVDVQSVFELPGAPDERWVQQTPPQRGLTERKVFKSSVLKGERQIVVYTPPGYSKSAGPYPLVVLFDGEAYLHPVWIQAADTLDNLVSARRIRPPVVCFVDTSATRPADIGNLRETFGDAIAQELMPFLRASYAISSSPRDVVVGGYSAGGKAGAHMALRYPRVFGNVLSQSGGFNAPDEPPGSVEPNALARMYARADRVAVRFYLDYGLYERLPNAERPIDELANTEGITGANRHFRDVLVAKGYDVVSRETGTQHGGLHWRSMLADGLVTLLQPHE